MRRRKFLQLATTTLAATTLPSCDSLKAAERKSLTEVSPLESKLTGSMPWLGKNFWANRLQDWQLKHGIIECRNGETNSHGRTVHILTRDLNAKPKPARLRATLHKLSSDGTGFGGFLIGAGGGELDYRSAALIHYAGGENGGLLACIDHAGKLSLRDFSDSSKPLAFDEYVLDQEEQNIGLTAFRDGQTKIILDCNIDPVGNDRFDIRLIAYDADSGEELSFIVKTGLSGQSLRGNIALASSPSGEKGARFGFSDIQTGGDKISRYPERSLGPVMGGLHSLNRSTLKLTAQFMPVEGRDWQDARLDYKLPGSDKWTAGPTAKIGEGYTALFKIENWDSGKDIDYRIVLPSNPEDSLFDGQVARDPGNASPLKIALHSCLLPTSRPIDRPTFEPQSTLEQDYGRYSQKSLLFPHKELVGNCDAHDPDIYVFLGDQYYETFPTRYGRSGPDKKLDTLYRWYLWFWTFRDSLRTRPCIVLADDHDILQGNIWGNGGDASLGDTEEDGGYKYDLDLVRMVYRMQCGHNPDNFDPTPIMHNIPVSYGNFVYGGTNFAFVEDRKWKTPPNANKGVPLTKTTGNLLGARQEAFLIAWKDMEPGLPKVCLTASIWGSPQTDAKLDPLVDYDANGYPPDGRTRAVKLLSEANAVAIAGDQHLGMVARQGVDDFEDGPAFFAGPAGAAFWQRWFEGQDRLENQYKDNKDSGNFVDCFGNKMRVLAVANPKITHAEFLESKDSWGYFVGDYDLKSEGYGIVKVDHSKKSFVFECWPWDAAPSKDKQFYGWPISVPFDKAGKA